MTITENEAIPDFTAASTAGEDLTLSDLRGKNVVLYFYPKDSTPGCTTEGQNFRDNHEAFAAENTVILGVSRDSIKSHNNFRTKQEFPFHLLSDADEQLCDIFDVIKEKNMYGKKVMGIERSTFLIDNEGVLRKAWRKVRVPGHVDAVLEEVKSL